MPFNHEIDPETGLIVKLDRRQLVYSPHEWFDMDFGGTRWRIEDLLPDVGTSMIAGGPKTGKGSFARQMALSVSEDTPFLGRPVRQGRVLYASRQEKLNELRSLFLQANKGKKSNVFLSPLEASQSTKAAEAVRELYDLASDAEPVKLIVLDMLQSFFQSDDEDYGEKFSSLEPLGSLAVDLNCHICVLHHANKTSDAHTMDVRSVLGSGAIAGSVDQVILLGKDKRTFKRAVCTEQRFGTGMERHWLDFAPETRTVSLGKKLHVISSDQTGRDTKQEDEKVLNFLQSNPGSTLNYVRGKLHWSYPKTKNAIKRLVEQDRIRPNEGGKGGGIGYRPAK